MHLLICFYPKSNNYNPDYLQYSEYRINLQVRQYTLLRNVSNANKFINFIIQTLHFSIEHKSLNMLILY